MKAEVFSENQNLLDQIIKGDVDSILPKFVPVLELLKVQNGAFFTFSVFCFIYEVKFAVNFYVKQYFITVSCKLIFGLRLGELFSCAFTKKKIITS